MECHSEFPPIIKGSWRCDGEGEGAKTERGRHTTPGRPPFTREAAASVCDCGKPEEVQTAWARWGSHFCTPPQHPRPAGHPLHVPRRHSPLQTTPASTTLQTTARPTNKSNSILCVGSPACASSLSTMQFPFNVDNIRHAQKRPLPTLTRTPFCFGTRHPVSFPSHGQRTIPQ